MATDRARFAPSVYLTPSELSSLEGPRSVPRYAYIKSLKDMFAWSLGDATTIDNRYAVGHSGGANGRWLRIGGINQVGFNVRGVAPSDVANLLSVSTTLDNVTYVDGDRILLPFQTSTASNGIYIWRDVSGGIGRLARAPEMDSAEDFTYGARVSAQEGDLYGGTEWQHQTVGTVSLETTPLSFQRWPDSSDHNTVAALSQFSGALLTRVAISSNLSSLVSVSTSQDGATLEQGDQVLLTGQTDGRQNGFYIVSSVIGSTCSLLRSSNYVTTIPRGLRIYVTDGDLQRGDWVNISEGTAVGTAEFRFIKLRAELDARLLGAIGDGVSDDADALQLGIDALAIAGGGTLILASGNTFATASTLTLATNVRVEMHGAIIKALPGLTGHLLSASSVSGIDISGGRLEAHSTPQDSKAALYFNQVSRFNIDNIYVKGWDFAIQLYKSDHGNVQGITIEGPSSGSTAGDGLIFNGCSNVSVSGVIGIDYNKALVYFSNEPLSNTVNTNLTVNNVVGTARSGSTFATGIGARLLKNSTISNVSISGAKAGGVFFQLEPGDAGTIENVVVSDVVITGSRDYGVLLNGTQRDGDLKRIGLHNIRVDTSGSGAFPGIDAVYAYDCIASNLRVADGDTGSSHGIALVNCQRWLLSNLHLQTIRQHGLSIDASNDIVITDISVFDTSQQTNNSYSDIFVSSTCARVGIENYLCRATSTNKAAKAIYIDTGATDITIGAGLQSGQVGGAPLIDNRSGYSSPRRVLNNLRRSTGSAAPTTGTWEAGDLVWSTSPAAGGPLGWVCITGGSPGTWVPFGVTVAGTLTASQAVITDASKHLTSLSYTSSATGGTLVQRASGADAAFGYLSIGLSSVASAGDIRGTSAFSIKSKHSTSGDVSIIGVDGADNVVFGDPAKAASAVLVGSGDNSLKDGSNNQKVSWNSTGVAFNGQTPASRPDYTVTNHTSDRALNETADTTAQVANVLGTLISDLIAIGLLQ